MLYRMVLLILIQHALPVLAWDADGHRLTAAVATRYLNDDSKKAIRDLLGKTDLASASTWMDRERKNLGEPYSRWHYDNRPVCAKSEDKSLTCPQNNCLSEQLPRQIARLKSLHTPKKDRQQALYFVVHMVGDLHQPFHTGDHNDRGGNQLNVIVDLGQRKTTINLHKYWDSETLERARHGERIAAYSKRLIENYHAFFEPWTQGDSSDWQQESFTLARDVGYAALPGFQCSVTRDGDAFLLTDDYHRHAARVTEMQLTKAGMRLAKILNQSFSKP